MSDFLTTLSFSAVPLLLVVAFSSITPAAGAVLALRGETLLALALPSVAGAGMALALFVGVSSENSVALYAVSAVVTLCAVLFSSRSAAGSQRRQLRLAGLLVAGQVVSLTVMALSPRAQSHIAHLLHGEVLAAGIGESAAIVAIILLLLSSGLLLRHRIFAWCADQEHLRIGMREFRPFQMGIQTALVVVITIGAATVGPVLMTALLVFPALLGDHGRGGIQRYMVTLTIVGVGGCIGGFSLALVLDIPPSIASAAMVGALGVVGRVLWRRG